MIARDETAIHQPSQHIMMVCQSSIRGPRRNRWPCCVVVAVNWQLSYTGVRHCQLLAAVCWRRVAQADTGQGGRQFGMFRQGGLLVSVSRPS